MEVLAMCARSNRGIFMRALRRLRELDAASQAQLETLRGEETDLLTTLQAAVREGQTPNEEELLAKYRTIADQRSTCVRRYERQVAFVQSLYDQLDGHINYMNEKTALIAHLFPSADDSLGDKKKKKKRKKAEEQAAFVPEPALISDPNEPLYCFCKQISFGEMVACDNPDCEIEWFHFGCVGIAGKPPDPWFCPNCVSKAAD